MDAIIIDYFDVAAVIHGGIVVDVVAVDLDADVGTRGGIVARGATVVQAVAAVIHGMVVV